MSVSVAGRMPVPSLAAVGCLGGAWLAVSAASWIGLLTLTLINQVVLFGVAVVLPLALGGRPWWWGGAATGGLVSYLLPIGSVAAGLAVAPFAVAVAATVLAGASAAGPPRRWGLADAAAVLAGIYAVVSVGALVQSRLEIELLDLHEPIIELTSVHYMFAGSAALVLARATLTGADGGWRRIAIGAVGLTAAAPPIVATGFVTGSAVPQVGGAVLMTLGVWLTAAGHLRTVGTRLDAPVLGQGELASTGLLALSGLAIWVPMVLAVAWAAGQYWRVPALSVEDMARTHGVTNAFAFCLCGLLARRLDGRPAAASAGGPGRSPVPDGGDPVRT
jgi:hypothetical protein